MRLFLLFMIIAAVDAGKTFSMNLKRVPKYHSHLLSKKAGRFLRTNEAPSLQNKIGSTAVLKDKHYDYYAYLLFSTKEGAAQYVPLIIDTGSQTTWVPGTGCITHAETLVNCAGVEGGDGAKAPEDAAPFNPEGGELYGDMFIAYGMRFTSKRTGETVLQANVSGKFMDVDAWLSIFPDKFEDIGEMKIGVAEKINLPLDYGILGLSARPTPDEATRGTHMVDKLISTLDRGMFTLFFEDGDSLADDGGWLTFGDYDKAHCSEVEPTVLEVTGNKWEFEVESLEFKGDEKFLEKINVLSDSGAVGFVVPRADYDKIMEAIGGVEEGEDWPRIPCARKDEVKLKFRIGKMPYPIPVDALVLPDGDTGKCIIEIRPNSYSNDNQWSFGTPWARSYCQMHHFEYVGRRFIGFSRVLKHHKSGAYH